jgi:hypothetical protein
MTDHEQHAIAACFMGLVSRQSDGYHVTPAGFGNPDHIVNNGQCACPSSPCYAPRAVELYLERGGSDEVVQPAAKRAAVDLRGFVTPPQKTLIGVLCAAQNLNAEDVSRRHYGVALSALKKWQASRIIEALRKTRAA